MGLSRFVLRLVLVGAALILPGIASAETVPMSRAEITGTFAPLVADTAPAVVSIQVKQAAQTRRRPSSLFDDPFFQRFFGPNWPGIERDRPQTQQAVGSGVIVRPNGLVVTNHHVIKGADEILVTLNDRRLFPATLVVSDERTDLALLQIDGMGEALPFLDIEDGAAADRRLAVGDLVLAIGNPFGVGQTVTIGIISALARQAPGISDYAFFIQTDAAINPGNSGGALVDVTGKVVGINTAIFSQDGGSLGIGFAVPARMVEAVIRSVDTNGSIVRPWFGASGKSVTPEIASVLGMARPAGVLIESVIEGGPAFNAGIRRGDVIEAVAGNEVIGVEGLRFGIATLPLGDETGLRLRRDGSYLETTFVAMAPPEEPPRNLTNLRGSNPFAGSRIANLSPAVAEEMGLALQSFMGVVIDAVARSSPARRTGLKRGDIIVRLNGKDISTIEDLQLALDDADRRWDVSIRRDGRIITTTISG